MLGNFEYKKVRSVEEGSRCLVDAGGSGAILAGGTDLLVEIRNSIKSPSLLVDCKGIEALSAFEHSPIETNIGASVPLNQLIEHKSFRETFPALTAALLSIGTYQLRSRATVAGNICNASPAADSAPVLLVRGAVVEATGANGVRSIPIQEFFTGVKKTSLQLGEIVTSVRLPAESGLRTAFLKQQRVRGHDLAVANIAGAYTPESNTLRMAIGSCAPTPVLMEPIPVDSNDVGAFSAHVAGLVMKAVSPISDVRASAAYRNAVLPTLARRIVYAVLDGQGGGN